MANCKTKRLFLLTLLLSWIGGVWAATVYVVPPGTATPSPNYTNWATAATNIQDAVNVAANGDTVLVSNGVYYATGMGTNTSGMAEGTNMVYINKGIIVLGLNTNPANVIVHGNGYTNRLFYIANGNALVAGFTITNGYAGRGSGVYIDYGGMISNCILSGNSAWIQGGAVFCDYRGTVKNCVLSGNSAISDGGACYFSDGGDGGTIENCRITGNSARYAGGGAVLVWTRMHNCVITGNVSTVASDYNNGGGVTVYGNFATISNCVFQNNSAYRGGGISVSDGGGLILRNCLVIDNRCTNNGGAIFINTLGVKTGLLDNCTLAGNYANRGGGIYIDGTSTNCSISDSIVYFNSASTAGNDYYDAASPTNAGVFSYSCLSSTNGLTGMGNITNNPLLVDTNAGNYRLSANSPCINTGTNQDWMTNAVDLDDRQRIRYGTVDMGAYEAIYNGTIYGFH